MCVDGGKQAERLHLGPRRLDLGLSGRPRADRRRGGHCLWVRVDAAAAAGSAQWAGRQVLRPHRRRGSDGDKGARGEVDGEPPASVARHAPQRVAAAAATAAAPTTAAAARAAAVTGQGRH